MKVPESQVNEVYVKLVENGKSTIPEELITRIQSFTNKDRESRKGYEKSGKKGWSKNEGD